MKRLFTFIAVLLLAAATLSAQRIRSVDIDVYINEEGDSYIKQVWDVDIVSGTEWYIPIGNLGGMRISGLKVSENGEEFIDEGREWDSSRSRAEKAGRSGIIDKGKNGVELCWGQGNYGHHVWEVGFVALRLVQSLEDYDAFNFMFINPDMIAGPEKATVTFHRLDGVPFSTDSTRFWFFGTEGESQLLEDGTIRFEVEKMRRSDSVIAMMRFDKGVFKPELSKDMKFEDMQKKAFKGSDYEKKKGLKGILKNFSIDDLIDIFFELLIGLVVVGFLLLMVFVWIKDQILKATGRQWSSKFFGSSRVTGWAREAPFKGSLPVAAYLLKDGSRLQFKNAHTERAIGAYFLRWIQQGLVTPVKAADGHYDLQFPEEMPDFAEDSEVSLFRKAQDAAKLNGNYILEKGEFDSWAEKHYKSLANWPTALINEGKSKYSGFNGDKIAEGANLIKFKNFLNDFTISDQREVPEVTLWGQYLEFAQLFGIADKVAKGFAKMYPTEFNDYSQRFGLDSVTMCTVVDNWSRMSSKAYDKAYSTKLSKEAEARSVSSGSSGGYGGFSSRGGGGGFSGGGHGGGSR